MWFQRVGQLFVLIDKGVQAEYNELQKAKRNAEYLAMLNKSDEELKAGKVVVKTMEELEAMENQNYEYFIYRYRLGTIHRMARARQKDHKENQPAVKEYRI